MKAFITHPTTQAVMLILCMVVVMTDPVDIAGWFGGLLAVCAENVRACE